MSDASLGALLEVPLEQVLVDPKKNYVRGGTADDAKHPKVREIIDSLEGGSPLLEPVGVRKLEAPGPNGELYELVYGFRRFTAVRAVGWKTITVVVHEVDERAARRMNCTENFVREAPTEYELAAFFAMICKDEQLSAGELARQIGSRANYVEQLVRIFEQTPREILDQWRLSPLPDYRRALDRISKIKGATDVETRRLQLDDWTAFLAARDAAPATDKDNPFRYPRAARAMGRREIEAFRATVDVSHEVHDATGWRPLSELERQTLHAVLVYVASPRGKTSPLR